MVTKRCYPNSLAESVVEAFLEKYSRATKIVADSVGVPYETFVRSLQHAFRYNQIRFNQIKRTIKHCNNDPELLGLLEKDLFTRADKIRWLQIIRGLEVEYSLDQDIPEQRELFST